MLERLARPGAHARSTRPAPSPRVGWRWSAGAATTTVRAAGGRARAPRRPPGGAARWRTARGDAGRRRDHGRARRSPARGVAGMVNGRASWWRSPAFVAAERRRACRPSRGAVRRRSPATADARGGRGRRSRSWRSPASATRCAPMRAESLARHPRLAAGGSEILSGDHPAVVAAVARAARPRRPRRRAAASTPEDKLEAVRAAAADGRW